MKNKKQKNNLKITKGGNSIEKDLLEELFAPKNNSKKLDQLLSKKDKKTAKLY